MKRIFSILLTVLVGSLYAQESPYNPDANGNNTIEINDMLIFLSHFGNSGPWAGSHDFCKLNAPNNEWAYFFVNDECDFYTVDSRQFGPNINLVLPDSTDQNRVVSLLIDRGDTYSDGTFKVWNTTPEIIWQCWAPIAENGCANGYNIFGRTYRLRFIYSVVDGWSLMAETGQSNLTYQTEWPFD